jgi:signal transduction histidine kinase
MAPLHEPERQERVLQDTVAESVRAPGGGGSDQSGVLLQLQERIKELTALHQTAQILQDDTREPAELMAVVVERLPSAWQFPQVATARITFGEAQSCTPDFRETPWRQTAVFRTRSGFSGAVDVCYLEQRSFLEEERQLIDSLAEMLRGYFQQHRAAEALTQAHAQLEILVHERTEELRRANASLKEEILRYEHAEAEIKSYQGQLRRLASELLLTEERGRRAIAAELHDHLGQALAFVKMKALEFAGNAVFCGFEHDIGEITTLLDRTIQYTRSLTCEISPPVLYELGLGPAIEWLADQFRHKHGLCVDVRVSGDLGSLPDELRIMVFQSVRELLTNIVKHAKPNSARVFVGKQGNLLTVEVADDGLGFDLAAAGVGAGGQDGFGLFSIRERVTHLGGRALIQSKPGAGTHVRLDVPLKHGTSPC